MGQTTEELNAEIAGTREDLASNLDALQDRVSPQAIINRRKEGARNRFRDLRSRVMGSNDSGTSGASGSGDTVRGTAEDVAGTAREKLEGSPLAAGVIAFGAGMIVAALLPATKPEVDAAQRLADTAQEQGDSIVESARSAGQEMTSGLQDSARDAAQSLAEHAKESATRMKDEGQHSAERVQS
jgi:ElaB/YqjD/DUF883 family membrane-anchored ribosome-binding protein